MPFLLPGFREHLMRLKVGIMDEASAGDGTSDDARNSVRMRVRTRPNCESIEAYSVEFGSTIITPEFEHRRVRVRGSR